MSPAIGADGAGPAVTEETAECRSPEVGACLAQLAKYRETVKKSRLLEESIEALAVVTKKAAVVRTLALGSPTDSAVALYQLAYIMELASGLGIAEMSLFDPAFSAADKRLFEELKMQVTECNDFASDTTLWFLPHAALDLTDSVLLTSQPKYLLANNVVAHTDRLTRLKLHECYEQLSLLVNLLGPSAAPEDNDFIVVERKPKRKNKRRFEPPKIVHDYAHTYFTKADQHVLANIKGVWGHAFTDLAFHELS